MRTQTIIIPIGFNAEQSEENVMNCFSPEEYVEWMSHDKFLEQYLYEQKSQRPLKVWLLVSDSPGEMIIQEGRLLPALGRKCVNISTLLLWYKSQHLETTVEVIRVLPVIIDQRRVEILDEWFGGLPTQFHTIDLEQERLSVPGDMPFAQFLRAMDSKAVEIIKGGGESCIYEPIAAAIGIGLDVLSPDANMVIHIGNGTSEVAVLALGGIVTSRSIQIAGDEFNDNIINYMRRKHRISIDEATAEQIKINVGSAIEDLDNPPADYEVCGRDLLRGGTMAIKVNYREVAEALDQSISEIEAAILSVLKSTPPESSNDIYENGIYLSGGGALLRGLDKRISQVTHLPVHIAADPLNVIARGTDIALKEFDQFPFLVKYVKK